MKTRNTTLLALTLAGAVATSLFTGCASHPQAAKAGKPGSGIVEYRALVSSSRAAVENVLQSLAAVSAQSNQVSRATLEQFSARIRDLHSESLPVRARAKVVLDRGEDYFKNWQEHLAQVEDKQVRARIEENRPQLQQHFNDIKILSQQTREAFRPFMDSLRQSRNLLEKDSAGLSGEAGQKLMKTASDEGRRFLLSLDGIQRNLDAMTALITPSLQPQAEIHK